MDEEHRRIILRSLGLESQNGESHRNRYRAHDGDPKMEGMVSLGFMARGPILGDYRCYRVTHAGAEAAGVLDRCRREDLP